ncbi:MAG: ribonuclease E/G, partial [Phycisphaerales bacterium]|nr:ribonuclease E/G [Phycisphaerales bacterium]
MTEEPTAATMPASNEEVESSETPATEASPENENAEGKKKTSRRRGRRGGRKKKAAAETEDSSDDGTTGDSEESGESGESDSTTEATEAAPRKKTRRKTSRKKDDSDDAPDDAGADTDPEAETDSNSEPTTKKKAGSRKKTKKKSSAKSKGDASGESKPASSSKKRSGRSSRYADRLAIEVTPVGPSCEPGARTMLVDDQSGEECRIAFIENGVLEELFIERTATATSVGNIYKGRVINVEAAIQAAFVDFGHGQNGFLHVSDLHPKYFPGGDKTEKVGRKTPRRERPPIQDALKKGQEILVQVLKQGVGTKGPTLTSYLSIPGRLLVMMPGMDRVGVSRKVEDDEQRREMRRILDDLELPEGFGFILRTAGFERGKTELKRDAAYLQRLWKQMEKRMNSVGAPAELYTEGNLLVRSIRDMVDTSVGKIITNGRKSFDTAQSFLSVVAPRSAPPVYYFDGDTPLFERYGVEKQVDRIHSREVPLRSGGALVIDQTEALVAIDVNSGR